MFKKRRKIRRRMFTSSIKRGMRRFHVVVVQWTSKICTMYYVLYILIILHESEFLTKCWGAFQVLHLINTKVQRG